MENRYRIIIPAYNCGKWIRRCIWSVVNQNFLNNEYDGRYQTVFLDDCSNDNTFQVVQNTIQESGEHKLNWRFFRRNNNVGALENIVYGINSICFNDEDIIILLDGDDALFSNDVITYLDSVYQDPKIQMTYGQYQSESNGALGCSRPLEVPSRDYRTMGHWRTSHLRTFKYKLWKRIQDVDLRDPNGKYFAMAWDMAIIYPLIEMAGNDRIKFIDKIMYLYNDTNPINDFKKNLRLQESTARYIKSKKKYRMMTDDEI